jgi:hypothetical protein
MFVKTENPEKKVSYCKCFLIKNHYFLSLKNNDCRDDIIVPNINLKKVVSGSGNLQQATIKGFFW